MTAVSIYSHAYCVIARSSSIVACFIRASSEVSGLMKAHAVCLKGDDHIQAFNRLWGPAKDATDSGYEKNIKDRYPVTKVIEEVCKPWELLFGF